MVKYRKLLNRQRVKEAPASVAMTIDSKCPKKWAFVDMETGDVWVHRSRLKLPKSATGTFYRADYKAVTAIRNIVEDM